MLTIVENSTDHPIYNICIIDRILFPYFVITVDQDLENWYLSVICGRHTDTEGGTRASVGCEVPEAESQEYA
jgi:hypothetical protein